MEAPLPYVCLCFGWIQDLLEEVTVPDLAAAEQMLLAMLDRGGMIVHVYRDNDQEHPELVGKHRRLRSLRFSAVDHAGGPEGGHEIERFLLDAVSFRAWADALKRNATLEQRWAVVDLWPLKEEESAFLYGRATLISQAGLRPM